ncbi:hypothetical protein GGI03_005782 [Coemansia sp. RSA 2337]|nr:hypothetical protein LPJ71_009657 [Coemansia sp. S17]KAJ2077088.1 hypothetical protein GGI16_008211 [Coemansia sp. S142-1]KAJ2458574.1 hypothetical protein GGI03_005782 [Coemansia sp. RSA 2337]
MAFRTSPEFSYLAQIIGRPLGDVPTTLLPRDTFSAAEDVKLVTNGAAIARKLIKAGIRQKAEEYVLSQVAQVMASEELSADDERNISSLLNIYPDIISQIPADTEHIRTYASRCWFIVLAIIDKATSPVDINRVILDSITQPMSTIHHSQVAGALFHNIGAVFTSTLFVYLNAVEASCRNHQDNSAQVQHHVKHAAMVLEKALLDDPSIAEQMSIELSSFCLSYPWVKRAADLYRLLSSMLDKVASEEHRPADTNSDTNLPK